MAPQRRPDPSVSVLLPARDAGQTLADAIDCLLVQEGLDDAFEILVADDGSLDDTLVVAQAAARRNPRVRVLALPRAGLVNALNQALARARGRTIARMDADDLCSPDRLVRQLHHLERHPDLDVVGTAVRMFPEEIVSPNMKAYVAWQNRLVIHRAMERNLLVECPLTHGTALFRRGALEAVGGWRDFDGPEDLDLWLRGAAAGWRFGKVNRVLYDWREHPNRFTRANTRARREAFRRVAMDAFSAAVEPGTPVLLWGWGASLEAWSEGLQTRGLRVDAVSVNPRGIRGGRSLPPVPRPDDIRRFGFVSTTPGRIPSKGSVWIAAYGTEASRTTIRSSLGNLGFRSGRHFRFVS